LRSITPIAPIASAGRAIITGQRTGVDVAIIPISDHGGAIKVGAGRRVDYFGHAEWITSTSSWTPFAAFGRHAVTASARVLARAGCWATGC
jgi:hypothetical protein